MGYTHYCTQKRDFTKIEWQQVSADVGEILKYVEHAVGIPLVNGNGDPGSKPEFTLVKIWFNGSGEDSHEPMAILRKRSAPQWKGDTPGCNFCKTARKPYDLVVTAVLCYLATVAESHSVTSDGDGTEFLAGLDLARKALPNYANVLDIPKQVMEDDRFCAPWVSTGSCKNFSVNFCIDGHGYVFKKSTKEWRRFTTHLELANFLDGTKRAVFPEGRTTFTSWGDYGPIEENIWNATGCFDKKRHDRIARAQTKILSQLFPVASEHASSPPAYARPGEMPKNAGRDFCYSVDDLIKLYGSQAA